MNKDADYNEVLEINGPRSKFLFPDTFLNAMFERQKALNKKIGYDLVEISKDPLMREFYSKEFILATKMELSELLDWMNWKIWKKTKVVYDEERIKEIHLELIDILHFWTNLCILWSLDPLKIFKLFEEKNEINLKRQREGY